MKIRLLTENMASEMPWLAEWGFSAWIEYDATRILFDTGFSDVYVRNAEYARLDLHTVDVLALSHFHRDHTRGLLFHPFTSRKTLVAHPRVLTATLKTKDQATLDDYTAIQSRLRDDFDVKTSRAPYAFAPGAYFLGEIPRVTPFEKGAFFDDPMEDDTALAFETPEGCVVVSGCAHAGICNICEHAKTVTGQRLRAVIGGFHLLANEGPPVEQTIRYFETEQPDMLMPLHCIDFDIQARFQNHFGYDRAGAGSLIEL